MKSGSLFPQMEAEIASDKLAEKRESIQRAREYLADKAGVERWVMNRLRQGPCVDANMMLEVAEMSDIPETACKAAMSVITVLWAMWFIGKLKRKPLKRHPSGEKCFTYYLK